jgi:hypothetical protein
MSQKSSSPLTEISPVSPPPENNFDSDPDMALHDSLQETLKHPSSVNPAWMDTIGDIRNNPRPLHAPPYNDGSLHWVDTNNELLHMAFPAVLDLYGKYGKIGPYFSLMTNQVRPFYLNSLICNIFSSHLSYT